MDAAKQQWAEVEFVPNLTAYSKKDPYYRFPGPSGSLCTDRHCPAWRSSRTERPDSSIYRGKGWYKVSGVVTNRTIAGEELIRWYRERCGKGEEVHGALKTDLAAGRLPSGLFGANAAWWSITTLAFNLNSAVKQLAMGGEWLNKRPQGSPIRRRQPARADGAPQQTADHTPDRRPPVLRPADRDAPEHIGSGRRPMSPAHSTLAVCRRRLSTVVLACHVHLGPSAVSNGAKRRHDPSGPAPAA